MQVITDAKELEKHTYIKTRNPAVFPKKERLGLAQRMMNEASDLVADLMEANDLLLTDPEERELRYRAQRSALRNCRKLISIKVTYKSEGLQKLRKAAGLSQSQLADLAGIKVQVLQQYERGARDINGAKLPTLLKICNALECRLADIITDEETLELLKKYEEH